MDYVNDKYFPSFNIMLAGQDRGIRKLIIDKTNELMLKAVVYFFAIPPSQTVESVSSSSAQLFNARYHYINTVIAQAIPYSMPEKYAKELMKR